MKFPTKSAISTVRCCYPGEDVELAAVVDNITIREIKWEALPGDSDNEDNVVINEKHLDQPIVDGC